MKRITIPIFILAIITVFIGFYVNCIAGEKTVIKSSDQKIIERKLDDSLGMPMLKGDVWLKMTHDSKVAFIWGFGHVVTIENTVMDKYPELKREGFVTKAAEGMNNIPMNEVVAIIDSYYSSNADKIEEPVTKVIWDTMIRPNIQTGIAGRPL